MFEPQSAATGSRGPLGAHSSPQVFLAGAVVGLLGGMTGLGVAQFRLPQLIGLSPAAGKPNLPAAADALRR